MAQKVTCSCGTQIHVSDHWAASPGKCPVCGRRLSTLAVGRKTDHLVPSSPPSARATISVESSPTLRSDAAATPECRSQTTARATATQSEPAATAWSDLIWLTSAFASRHEVLSEAQVVPEPANCIQCGCCSFNCPMGIDVRAHAWRGLPIHDSHCLTCRECVKRCPRGVLRFERIDLLAGS